LNPLKRKEISKITAEKLGKEFADVDEIVSFFYDQVQKTLSSISNIAVNVPNLGTFVLKKKRVLSKLEKYQQFLKIIEQDESLSAFEKRMISKQNIESYEAVLKIMQQEELRKEHVHTLKEKRNADKNLEGTE
jgi:nucleoid DNA-binding protein